MDLQNTLERGARKENSAFISKVFSLFGLSILSTGVGVYVGFHYLLATFVANPLIMYGLFAVELLLIIFSRAWSKTVPLNYFLFALFTFLSGVTVVPLIASFAAEFGSFDIIYRALFSTTVMFIAMALLGYSIKKPLVGFSGFLLSALIGLVVVSIIGIFLPWGNTGEMIFAGAGVLIFSGYAMVDVNNLRHYPEDEYIQAAIQLYLDIFNLFIFILRLTGAVSRD
ncbi:MAG: Bax inhibitor-1/YccA family protein [Patescibacteria group bacterium]